MLLRKAFLILGFVTAIFSPAWVRAEYAEDSFWRFKADGAVDLRPYIDFSKFYVILHEPNAIASILRDFGFEKREIIQRPDKNEFLLRAARPAKNIKEYVGFLNKILRDTRVRFTAPVFSFPENKDVPFRSILSIGDTVSVELKPGVRFYDVKEALARVGLGDSSVGSSGSGFISTVSKNNVYDPFRIATFFSPYFDPRMVESSLLWIRMEEPARTGLRIYPEGLAFSNAGVSVLEPLTVELSIETLKDVDFRPPEVGPETSLMRNWQPEDGTGPLVFEFLDGKPEIVRKDSGRTTTWVIKFSGRMLRFGDFSFPVLSVPVHLLGESKTVSLGFVNTNPVEIHVVEFSPRESRGLIRVGEKTLSYESYWRRALKFSGFGVAVIFGALALLFLSPVLMGIASRAKKVQELVLSGVLKEDLDDLSAAYEDESRAFADKDKWFEKLYQILSAVADILQAKNRSGYLSGLKEVRTVIQREQFLEWSLETRRRTYLALKDYLESIILKEGSE